MDLRILSRVWKQRPDKKEIGLIVFRPSAKLSEGSSKENGRVLELPITELLGSGVKEFITERLSAAKHVLAKIEAEDAKATKNIDQILGLVRESEKDKA